MTAGPTVSVIVVSWQRPQALWRCLVALHQQDYPAMDLIVVADAEAVGQTQAALQSRGWAATVAVADVPNIAQARNTGLALAHGEIVAFIDDDAVAEPTWVSRLTAPFSDPSVVAATGYTRGRNGISLQWAASMVDHSGFDHPLPRISDTRVHPGTARRAVKPVGTNCAFRRRVLMQAGGFDPGYRFYLEDADIGLRLGGLGQTAVVPGAQVHHGFAPSMRRRADRAPLTLYDIGASSMVFLRRHAPPPEWPYALTRLRGDQRSRLIRMMQDGRLEPRDIARLLRSLEAGVTEGAARDLPPLQPLTQAEGLRLPAFVAQHPGKGRVIAGWVWQAKRLRKQAAQAVATGQIVTLFLFSPTLRPQRHWFDPAGFWVQKGGLFGPSNRDAAAFRLHQFQTCLQDEVERIGSYRPIA